MNVAQAPALADAWGMHGDVGMAWWIVMVVVIALFWGAIIFGAALLLRRTVHGRPAERDETPTGILDRRFAEGAISLQAHEERKQTLASAP